MASDLERSACRADDTTPQIPSIAPQGLCDGCSALDLEAYFKKETDSEITEDGWIDATKDARSLGLLTDIWSRAVTCSFCWIVIQSVCRTIISPEELFRKISSTSNSLECCVASYCFTDSRRIILETEPRIKAVRLHIATRISPAVTDMDVTKESPDEWDFILKGDIQILGEDSLRILRRQAFCGRRVDCRLDIRLAYSWLDLCKTSHGKSCGWNISGLNIEPTNVMVIDTDQLCVIDLPPGARYLALSYCWPPSRAFCLTEANKGMLFQSGALKRLSTHLPSVIVDALEFVQEFGERFLWVDALCIVQDSDEHKASQMAQMNKIYMSALMTIVPLIYSPSPEKACAGFPRYNPSIRCREQKIAQVQNMNLAVPFEAVSALMLDGQIRWGTRGWTFQECLLSPRVLFLTESQAYFRCRRSIFCEDCWGESDATEMHIFRYTKLWNPGSASISIGRVSRVPGTLLLHKEAYRNDKDALVSYQNCVEEYSYRRLTNISDTLNAFRGIQNVLENLLQTSIYYGLTERYWDIELLFNTCSRSPRSEQIGKSYPRNRPFPSWSWAGWDCGINNGYFPTLYPTYIRHEVDWFLLIDQRSPYAIDSRGVYKSKSYLAFGNKDLCLGEAVPSSPYVQLIDNCVRANTKVSTQSPILACWTMANNFYLADAIPISPDLPVWKSSQYLALRNCQQEWVGCVMIDNTWIERSFDVTKKYEFIIISRSRTLAARGVVDDGEIPNANVFDTKLFANRLWCLLNVMMVERHGDFYERVALGVVHEEAWLRASPTMILAMLK
ncbi:HET-domain-containing protein [Nemania sp. FL0916]|nr:HET-domain-containing protein [Nemania sp. FL0916]